VIAVFLYPTAPAQNNNQPAPEDFTRVYAYTYDDVFQSVQSALLGLHWDVKVDETNKDRGFVVATRKAFLELDTREWPPSLPPCTKQRHLKGTRCNTPPALLTTKIHIEVVKPNQTRVTLEFRFRADDTKEDVEVSPITSVTFANPPMWHGKGAGAAGTVFDKLGFILSTLG
jgi:hypothetical protein